MLGLWQQLLTNQSILILWNIQFQVWDFEVKTYCVLSSSLFSDNTEKKIFVANIFISQKMSIEIIPKLLCKGDTSGKSWKLKIDSRFINLAMPCDKHALEKQINQLIKSTAMQRLNQISKYHNEDE